MWSSMAATMASTSGSARLTPCARTSWVFVFTSCSRFSRFDYAGSTRSTDVSRADQDAYVRGEIDIVRLGERVRARYGLA